LASKIFLGFSLVILVLAAVGVLSLRAVGRLVSLNREVASETLPALRLTADVRDSMLALARLEARFTILRDWRYASVWGERAEAGVARLETRTWTGVVVAVAASLGLALVATAVIAVRITRSLRHLSAATSAVAAGSFREPIPVGGNDEVGVLARSFNAMAARLRQLDEMKEEFFATLSHELRSPLTSVREASHLLADQVAGPMTPKQARLVEIIQRSSDRLL